MSRFLAFALAAFVLFSSNPAQAGFIGNWSGSARSWNNGDMATLKATMITAGHTVEADESISAANLSNNTHFVIGEPGLTPTGAELSALGTWVQNGGILLLLADSANSGLPALNNIAAGIGSSLTWSGSAGGSTTLLAGNFATEGPPYNIVGQNLSTTSGTAVVSGGAALAGDFLRFEQLGSGFVFAFADRSDHNFFAPTNSNTNGQLFLNIAAGAEAVVPVPAGAVLFGLGMASLGGGRLLRRRPTAV